MDALAAQLRTAFNSRDVDTFRALLAEDASWGDDPASAAFCRNRNEIVANLKRLLDDGVRATIVDTTAGPLGIACELDVEWPATESSEPDHQILYQAYLVTDRRITEIHGHEDQASAVAAVSH